MPELVPVRVRDCACPDSPHEDGDIVYLLPTLPMAGGIMAEDKMVQMIGGDSAVLKAEWLDIFVRHGATSWNLVDAEGEPVPFDVDVIIADWRLARPVADKASDLYADSVMAPFQNAPAKQSPTGRTVRTTSRRQSQTRSLPA